MSQRQRQDNLQYPARNTRTTMPFVRGLVFSSTTVEGSPELKDQLSLLQGGGLRLALLRPQQAAAPGVPVSDATTGAPAGGSASDAGSASTCPEGIDLLDVPPGDDGDAAAAAAGAAAAGWAARRGLQWPAEVLVLGPPGDEAGRLRSWLEREAGAGPGAGAGVGGQEVDVAAWGLPGLVAGGAAEVGGDQKAAGTWQRLRLALAHENLRRATETAAAAAPRGAPTDLAGPPPPPTPLVVAGYTMKPSRERDLAREGLINLVPQDGVVFAPLDLSLPLERQLPFHAVLHKASDELEYGSDGVPVFGPRVRHLAAFAAAHPAVSLVDPLEAAAKVINRTELARVCESLSAVNLSSPVGVDVGSPVGVDVGSPVGGDVGRGSGPATKQQEQEEDQGSEGGRSAKLRRVDGPAPAPALPRVRVRAPRSTTLSSFTAEEVAAAVQRLGCPPPYIVKPVVACGTPDSHRMALVLRDGGALRALALPLPAVVQEFVNHDATIFKVYVAADKVFHTVRPSIPNVPSSPEEAAQVAPRGFLEFDSLKSLPTTLGTTTTTPAAGAAAATATPPAKTQAAAAAAPVRQPSQLVLERLAAHLRRELGLSLFGFDVVIASRSSSSFPCAPASDMGQAITAGSVAAEAPASSPSATGASTSDAGGLEEGGEAAAEEQELVVIDVNYFPSYRGADGAAAMFRSAVLGAHERQQQRRLGREGGGGVGSQGI